MRHYLAIVLVMIGGCISTPPVIPVRFHLGVPEACSAEVPASKVTYTCPYGHTCFNYTNIPMFPEAVYIDPPEEKFKRDGNCYSIRFFVMTNDNCNSPLGEDPLHDSYHEYLRTNYWPSFRNHMDLSIDGGSNFIRRIGYGIQRDATKYGGEFIWSPPRARSILTEQAVLRMTDLDGRPFDNGDTNMPFNLRPGEYVKSYPFAIRGGYIVYPVTGSILYNGVDFTLKFFETGGGPVWDMGWLTQADPNFHLMNTFSNVVGGVTNTLVTTCTIPLAPEVRVVFWSHADRAMTFQSESFSVE